MSDTLVRNDEDTRIERGSGDFLKDMGYPEPDETRIKIVLANAIALAIEDKGLKQTEAAGLVGLAQSDVSKIVNGNLKEISIFRLMKALAALGKDISICVADASSDRGAILALMNEPEPELQQIPTP